MADDRHYVPGSFYRICDRTGFKVRAERTRKEWNDLIVRRASYEARQPQDFVRGIVDRQNVPEPRPRQPNVFLGAQTTLAVDAVPGDFNADYALSDFKGGTSLKLVDPSGFSIGSFISVITDDESVTVAQITMLSSDGSLALDRQLQARASSGALVTLVS